MRVLLTTLNAKYIHTNVAIRLLYALNHTMHKGLQWKEFTIKENPKDIAEYCQAFDVVAFSCYIWNISQTLNVITDIKLRRPDIKILLGGPEVSYEWQNIIENTNIDYIITGEGETPFTEFLNLYPNVQHIQGLIYKSNGSVHCNPIGKPFDVANFEEVNPYIYDDINELKNKVLYLETSRGCPYKCEFCLASLDNKVRYLPISSVKKTLLFLMQHGRTIKFLDRTFNIKRDFSIDIFQFILDNHRPGNVFQFEITADILHKDIIEFINEKVPKNLFRFEIGIQTTNQKANVEVSRKQNFDKTVSIIKQVESKVELHLDLIVGLPFDYWDDIKQSFNQTFTLRAPELQLGFLKFLKGTPVRDKHTEHHFVFDKNPPYQIIESNYLKAEELHQITLLEHALEIYWNNKRAINTLNYVIEKYDCFDFLLGLGKNFELKFPTFKQYTLINMYEILYSFAKLQYSNDVVLRQLIAIDYFKQHKVKPKNIFDEKWILDSKIKNENGERKIEIELNFDFYKFEKNYNIKNIENTKLIITYNGVNESILL